MLVGKAVITTMELRNCTWFGRYSSCFIFPNLPSAAPGSDSVGVAHVGACKGGCREVACGGPVEPVERYINLRCYS